MGKVYIGVMAVGGHKLWGVGGGRLTAGGWGMGCGGAGHARSPTGGRKGARVWDGFGAIFVGAASSTCRGGSSPPTVWGETGWQSSNGWLWSVRAGHARPYGWRKGARVWDGFGPFCRGGVSTCRGGLSNPYGGGDGWQSSNGWFGSARAGMPGLRGGGRVVCGFRPSL